MTVRDLIVTVSDPRLVPDASRVVTKRFHPSGALGPNGQTRTQRTLARVMALSESEVSETLSTIRERFDHRHRDLRGIFEANFADVSHFVEHPGDLSADRLSLIGAYFTHEYALEASALSNPSMVRAVDQTGLASGETRFIMSLRAIGEGHISSIEFRQGVIGADGQVQVQRAVPYASTARRRAPVFEKQLFERKLSELHATSALATAVLARLPDEFTLHALESAIAEVNAAFGSSSEAMRATQSLHWLAASNYECTFPEGLDVSERVLFPAAPTESSGMEDARFVRFAGDDGSITYYATYTAFDGREILPQLIETRDFLTFRISTLNGPSARNKGIALFPRKVGGRFLALGRLDNENNFLMSSADVRFWHDNTMLQSPTCAWEIVQLGNCGSPLETEAGWLVITHGVGAMRQYAIGALLLDLHEPTRVIGHLREPLLEANAEERDGYVPNVVYSCGSMIAGEYLVLPYGCSDARTRIATVRVDELLAQLVGKR